MVVLYPAHYLKWTLPFGRQQMCRVPYIISYIHTEQLKSTYCIGICIIIYLCTQSHAIVLYIPIATIITKAW